jgi:hypothetical protein
MDMQQTLSALRDPQRYAENPLLRLLDCYVLHVIGHLSHHNRKLLKELEPSLQETFSESGDWIEILESIMNLPPGLQAKILQMWRRNQEMGPAEGEDLTPGDFARLFVHMNLAPEEPPDA